MFQGHPLTAIDLTNKLFEHLLQRRKSDVTNEDMRKIVSAVKACFWNGANTERHDVITTLRLRLASVGMALSVADSGHSIEAVIHAKTV